MTQGTLEEYIVCFRDEGSAAGASAGAGSRGAGAAAKVAPPFSSPTYSPG